MTFVDFVTPVPADWLNNVNTVVNQGTFLSVNNIAALRTLSVATDLGHQPVLVRSYYSATGVPDGGGGLYLYDATDNTSTDNGGTVIVASDGSRWKLQFTGFVSLKQFGAHGDGVTDDTTFVQNAINAGVALVIPAGATVYCATSPVVSLPGLRFYGPGTFKGQLTIAMPVGTQPFVSILADVEIDGVTFANCTNPILCRRGRGIRVVNCSFNTITGASVQVRPLAVDFDGDNHCVENLTVANNFFTFVDYMVQIDTSQVASLLGASWWLGNGDTTITGNQCNVVNITHVTTDRVDGLVVTDNTFLNFGSGSASTIKRRCVEVTTRGAEVVIQNNQFFESGYEAVYLNYTFHYNISDNNFVQCGEVTPSSAIFCDFSPLQDSLSTVNACGVIADNTIFDTTNHAIQLQNQSEVVVTGNAITLGTGSGYYYGVPSLPTFSSRYGVGTFITAGGTSSAITVNNNPVYDNVTNQFNAGGSGTFYRDGIVHYDETGTNTFLNGNYQQINLNQSSPTTITTVNGGYDGQTIVLLTVNGITTIGTSGNIHTPTGSPVTLATTNMYFLYKYNGFWYLK